MIQQRTYGIAVQRATIPGAGDFSIWDFSGMKSYYSLHEEFLSDDEAILLLVFSMRDPPERQLAQLRFWLAMIRAKLPQEDCVKYCGERWVKPNIVLVTSFADLRSNIPELMEDSDDSFPVAPASTGAYTTSGQQGDILEELKQEFGGLFNFSDCVFSLDCRLSQSPGIRSLRNHIGYLKEETSASQVKDTENDVTLYLLGKRSRLYMAGVIKVYW